LGNTSLNQNDSREKANALAQSSSLFSHRLHYFYYTTCHGKTYLLSANFCPKCITITIANETQTQLCLHILSANLTSQPTN